MLLQTVFFGWHDHLGKLDRNEGPLGALDRIIDWEQFRPITEKIRRPKKNSSPGPKFYDAILMFKILILQSLYNLSDDAVELQILDRLSFMRFRKLDLGDRVPDTKTIWLFRDQLTTAGLMDHLFKHSDKYLTINGYSARKGHIVDDSIGFVPKQRNSHDDSQRIKQGETPEEWTSTKNCQKDVDARCTQKGGKAYYGYKNHIGIDVKNKFIRSHAVTDASVHDSYVSEFKP